MARSSKNQAQKHDPKPNPGLKQLDVLVGKWAMQASVGGQSLGSGRAEFEWIEGGAFLVRHEDAQPAQSLPTEMIAASPFPSAR